MMASMFNRNMWWQIKDERIELICCVCVDCIC